MYRAQVTAVGSGGVTVTVADLVPGFRFGPCEWVGTAPTVGDLVLVADVGEPQSPDLIVVGVIQP